MTDVFIRSRGLGTQEKGVHEREITTVKKQKVGTICNPSDKSQEEPTCQHDYTELLESRNLRK